MVGTKMQSLYIELYVHPSYDHHGSTIPIYFPNIDTVAHVTGVIGERHLNAVALSEDEAASHDSWGHGGRHLNGLSCHGHANAI